MTSRRTIAAPSTIALSLPKATSRGQVFHAAIGRNHQSLGWHVREATANAFGDEFRHFDLMCPEIEHAENNSLARQLLQNRAIEL